MHSSQQTQNYFLTILLTDSDLSPHNVAMPKEPTTKNNNNKKEWDEKMSLKAIRFANILIFLPFNDSTKSISPHYDDQRLMVLLMFQSSRKHFFSV